MSKAALDKLHSDKYPYIGAPGIMFLLIAKRDGSFHLLIPSFTVLHLLLEHHSNFTSDNLHLLPSGL